MILEVTITGSDADVYRFVIGVDTSQPSLTAARLTAELERLARRIRSVTIGRPNTVSIPAAMRDLDREGS